jgi:integrase
VARQEALSPKRLREVSGCCYVASERHIRLATLPASSIIITASSLRLNPMLGYLQVRSGKSKNAKRTISLTDRVSAMLGSRLRVGPRAFEISESTLQHQHQDLRDKLGLDPEFVLHSLRHTMLTRLGEQGTDAFTIKRIAGHSSITVSER